MRLALVGHLEQGKLKITSRKSLKASQLRLTFSCQKLLIWAKSRCSSIWKKYPSFRKNLPSKGKNIWLFSLLRKKSKNFSLESKEKFFDFFRCYEKNQKFFPLVQGKKFLIFFVATKKVKYFFLWSKGKNFWFFS